MKKVATLSIQRGETYSIEYDETTLLTFSLQNNPHYKKNKNPEYAVTFSGFEWGEQCFSLSKHPIAISPGQRVEIVFESSLSSNSSMDKELVVAETKCGFCGKLKEDVEVLIEKDMFSRICSECVEECIQIINERRNA